MKRLALALAVLALLAPAAWYGIPEAFRPALVDLHRRSAGLEERSIQVGSHRISYLEGGRGETVVLLHGLFAEKDHWVDFARSLTAHYRVIAPDLPGFGASTRLEHEPYDYAAQTQRLAALLDALAVRTVHLAGSSMGGTLAALLALEQPGRITSVAFIGAPHGIRTPLPSDMDLQIEAGRAPLVARNAQEFEGMMALLFAQPPFLPYPVMRAAQAQALDRAPSNLRLWREQLKDRHLLHERIAGLKSPLLVLWGGQDRVFDATGAKVLRDLNTRAGIEVLPQAGHLPMMEAPDVAAQRYAVFLQSLVRR
ncbi:alpha/beta fold hydrolase [Rhodoferax sp. BAB1]|uniref:alpha/beta fold hydrolase n=1 Tax=Rhodoferax sp. BAB1 TaxID=2741720 RepID=UPI00157592F9|nr:alpha/beta fold hydrolase [Rhodoferax sp. BAB1]QKO21405.1 alpha/beta fold hydrolase [Rhodoferax sp. BAB1]